MLAWLRKYAPPLAAVLLVIIAVQVLDVLPCMDEGGSRPAHTAGEHHAKNVTAFHHTTPDSGSGDHGGWVLPDCLCHVLFVPMGHPPVVGTPLASHVISFHPGEGTHSASLSPPDHVPLA